MTPCTISGRPGRQCHISQCCLLHCGIQISATLKWYLGVYGSAVHHALVPLLPTIIQGCGHWCLHLAGEGCDFLKQSWEVDDNTIADDALCILVQDAGGDQVQRELDALVVVDRVPGIGTALPDTGPFNP